MRIWKEIWDYAKMIIIVVVIVTLVNSVVLINAKIPSESMEKTIMTGDRIFGFRLAYGLNLDFFGHEISKKIKDPERFDIVIFKYPDDESKLFIKRVIGLPGEKVQIKDGKVYINDSEIPLDDRQTLYNETMKFFEKLYGESTETYDTTDADSTETAGGEENAE